MDSKYTGDNAYHVSSDSSDDLVMDSTWSMCLRIVCMGADALSLVCLLLPYMLMEKAKETMLGKLMQTYCILTLLALLAAFLHTLMEFVIPATNAACYIIIYVLYCAFLGSVTSKSLFLFHTGYIFYSSHKMVLKDTTEYQIFRLKVGYFLTIIIVPLVMILIIIIYNHALNEVEFTKGDRCLYSGDLNKFNIKILIGFVVCLHSMGVLMIIIITFLMHKAYQTQKAVGQDTKNLFRIAVGIGVAFGIAWIVFAFQSFYTPVAPLVFYSTAAVENLVIVSVFFYNNKLLTRIKKYFVNLKDSYHNTTCNCYC